MVGKCRALWHCVFATTCASCGGTALVEYKGTITSGSVATYSFDAAANPQRNAAIVDAEVRLFFLDDKSTCSEARQRYAENAQDTASGSSGEFIVGGQMQVSGWPSFGTPHVLLCVEKQGYQAFEYDHEIGKSTEPRQGEKYMNIVLQPVK